MDALSSLAMYSDSDDEEEEDEDNDRVMTDKHHSIATPPISTPNLLSGSDQNNDSEMSQDQTDVHHLDAPCIPSSPDIGAQEHDQQNIIQLLQQHKSHQNYLQHTFECAQFQDNPEIFAMLSGKLQLFQDNHMEAHMHWSKETDFKLDEYASALPLSIHDPSAFRDKEDNVDTLMRFLEEKIRENERRMQEKRDRKEKEKQLMLKERAERRVPTPTKHTHAGGYATSSQRYPHQQTLNALNAAKQAVLAQKSQFMTHRRERHSKRSRWDDQ